MSDKEQFAEEQFFRALVRLQENKDFQRFMDWLTMRYVAMSLRSCKLAANSGNESAVVAGGVIELMEIEKLVKSARENLERIEEKRRAK